MILDTQGEVLCSVVAHGVGINYSLAEAVRFIQLDSLEQVAISAPEAFLDIGCPWSSKEGSSRLWDITREVPRPAGLWCG